MKGSEDVQETDTQRQKIHAGKLIHMLSHRLKRQNIVPCGEDGLTTMQKHVLKFILLETLHRDIYQKDVEEEFQIRKSTATGILQLMEKNGFICRECSAKDARLKRIVPTEKAEILRREILENIRAMEKQLSEGIPEEDFKVCVNVLWKMFDNLAQTEDTTIRKEGGKRKQ